VGECGRLGIGGLEMFGAAPAPAAVPAPAPRQAVARTTTLVEAPREPVRAPAPVPAVAVSGAAPRTRRCWRCKEPVELPAESGGERPRCTKCGTLQWVPV
jgi:hypothetical protein